MSLIEFAIDNELSVHCFNRASANPAIGSYDGPLFVLREWDSRVIRTIGHKPRCKGPNNEQALRACVRQGVLSMDLNLEPATKDEIQLLKQANILGKRAPSGSLINSIDLLKLLQYFSKNEIVEQFTTTLFNKASADEITLTDTVKNMISKLKSNYNNIPKFKINTLEDDGDNSNDNNNNNNSTKKKRKNSIKRKRKAENKEDNNNDDNTNSKPKMKRKKQPKIDSSELLNESKDDANNNSMNDDDTDNTSDMSDNNNDTNNHNNNNATSNNNNNSANNSNNPSIHPSPSPPPEYLFNHTNSHSHGKKSGINDFRNESSNSLSSLASLGSPIQTTSNSLTSPNNGNANSKLSHSNPLNAHLRVRPNTNNMPTITSLNMMPSLANFSPNSPSGVYNSSIPSLSYLPSPNSATHRKRSISTGNNIVNNYPLASPTTLNNLNSSSTNTFAVPSIPSLPNLTNSLSNPSLSGLLGSTNSLQSLSNLASQSSTNINNNTTSNTTNATTATASTFASSNTITVNNANIPASLLNTQSNGLGALISALEHKNDRVASIQAQIAAHLAAQSKLNNTIKKTPSSEDIKRLRAVNTLTSSNLSISIPKPESNMGLGTTSLSPPASSPTTPTLSKLQSSIVTNHIAMSPLPSLSNTFGSIGAGLDELENNLDNTNINTNPTSNSNNQSNLSTLKPVNSMSTYSLTGMVQSNSSNSLSNFSIPSPTIGIRQTPSFSSFNGSNNNPANNNTTSATSPAQLLGSSSNTNMTNSNSFSNFSLLASASNTNTNTKVPVPLFNDTNSTNNTNSISNNTSSSNITSMASSTSSNSLGSLGNNPNSNNPNTAASVSSTPTASIS